MKWFVAVIATKVGSDDFKEWVTVENSGKHSPNHGPMERLTIHEALAKKDLALVQVRYVTPMEGEDGGRPVLSVMRWLNEDRESMRRINHDLALTCQTLWELMVDNYNDRV